MIYDGKCQAIQCEVRFDDIYVVLYSWKIKWPKPEKKD